MSRRWYQFGLRTLLIGVALLAIPCAYVGWQVRIVRAREAWMKSHVRMLYGEAYPLGMTPNDPNGQLPMFRRWLGDEAVFWMHVSPAEKEQAKELFPEATLETTTPPP